MRDFVSSLRQALQDILVPEFRALQGEVRHLGERVEETNQRLARLEDRLLQMHQDMDQRFLDLHRQMDERFAEMRQEMNERFTQVHQEMGERFAQMDQRFLDLHRQMDERFAEMRQEMDERFARVEERFARMDQRFEEVHREILALAKGVSEVSGKIDILVGHIVDYKAVVQLTVRVEQLEKRMEALTSRPSGGQPHPAEGP